MFGIVPTIIFAIVSRMISGSSKGCSEIPSEDFADLRIDFGLAFMPRTYRGFVIKHIVPLLMRKSIKDFSMDSLSIGIVLRTIGVVSLDILSTHLGKIVRCHTARCAFGVDELVLLHVQLDG
jgi:hypothetical protein